MSGFISSICYCQSTKEVIIEGNIINKKDRTLIPNALVIIKTDLGDLQKTSSDNDGHYSFTFATARFKKAEIYTQTNKDLRTPTSPLGFLASDGRLKIDIVDSLREKLIFKKDFFLYPMEGCRWFSAINFKKNQTKYDTLSPKNIDSVTDNIANYYPEPNINLLQKALEDNPNIIVELSAHCAIGEKDPAQLSQKRAEKIKMELVERGVDPKRLVAKGYGISKLLYTEEMLVKNKDDRAYLNSRNRRCVFKILSWDFKE